MLKSTTSALAFVAVAALASPAAAFDWQGFYVDLYGGLTAPSTSTYEGTPYDMLQGYALGGSIGVVVTENVAIELDISRTSAIYETEDYGLDNFAIMGVGEVSLPLGDVFAVYGLLGAGAVHITYYSDDYTGWGWGYQAGIGARATVAENMSIFGELKHIDTFAPVDVGGYDITNPTLSAVVGLRIGM